MTAFIRTTSLIGFTELVTRLRGNAEALLRRFYLDPEKVETLDGVISFRSQVNLFEESANSLRCDDFGLRLSEFQDLMVMGPVAVVALCEPDVGSVLRKIIQYLYFHTSGLTMHLSDCDHHGLCRLVFDTSEYIPERRQQMELTLAVAGNAARMLYGDDFRFHSVHLQGDSPLPRSRYEEYFRAPVHFNCDSYTLIFEGRQLERKTDRSDGHMHSVMEQFVRDVIVGRNMDLVIQVEQLIHCLLPTLRCSLKLVAGQLGMHPRTLQRRLAARALLFEDLHENVRRRIANGYLAEPDMPIAQVAGLAGYGSQSSFSRACQRWFGATPLQRRQQLSRPAPAPSC